MKPIDGDALKMALRLEYPMMPMFKESRKEWEEKTEGYRKLEEIIDEAPTIEPKTKVIAPITFDEDKLREIVHEAVERIKEEYDIVDGWIPCSERLPANDDWVIVSVFDECGDIPYRYSDFGWYLEVAKCWIVDSEQRTDVVAWMPLPAPCSM